MYILRAVVFLGCFGCICCSSCSSMNDCITCVSKDSWVPFTHLSCRWCPLSGQCHAVGSQSNPCPSGESITITAKCYETHSGVYDPEGAYLNTLLSAVAYSDHPQQCMDRLIPRGGFRIVHAIGKECSQFLFNYGECFAIVAVSDYSKHIIVAHRGTSSMSQLLDEFATTIVPKQPFKSGGSVQKYFNNAFMQLYPCVSDTIKEMSASKPDYDVVITGHSLGGAIASLTAASLVYEKIVPENKLSLYTFGMPRAGDKRYALAFDKLINNSWRVVHYKDPVARIPLGINVNTNNAPYHHRTEIYYPEDVMQPNSAYKVCSSNEDPNCAQSNSIIISLINIRYHTHYFDLQVGEACSDIGAGRRKRSADGLEISAMAEFFSNETCRRIDLGDDVSGAPRTTCHESCQLLSAFLVLTFLVIW